MIRHIVIFKLRQFEDEQSRLEAAKKVIEQLDKLPQSISQVRHYKAGIDIRRLDWSYDIALEMDFDSMADLDAYTVHPEHRKFIDFNKQYSVQKVSIDYEF